jgi:predicted Zn-ribbon and HTH transcriptional regulator
MKKDQELGMVLVPGARCRCGHVWVPHGGKRPSVCPKCKSANWDRPKKFEKKT